MPVGLIGGNSNLLDASNGTSNEKTSAIQSPHPQQGSKGDEANRVGTSKPRNNHLIRKTAAGKLFYVLKDNFP